MRRWRIAALAAGSTILVLLGARAVHASGNDFRVFRTAGLRFWAGLDLYPAADGFYAWRYAPGAAALFGPAALVPAPVARGAWVAASILLAITAAAIVHRETRARSWWAAPLALAVLVDPLFIELGHGQANLLVLVLVLAAFALEDRRPIVAGAVLAIAIGLKVVPVVVALDWALRRRFRAVAGVALGLAALAALPSLTFGPEGAIAQHLGWIGSELRWSGVVTTYPRNQSVWGLLGRAGAPRAVAVLAAAAIAAAALSVPDRRLRRALLLLAMPLASPYGWVQNFLLALPAAAELFARGGRWRWGLGLAAVASLVSDDLVGPGQAWALEHSVFAAAMLALFVLGCAAQRAGRRVTESESAAAPGRATGATQGLRDGAG